MSDDSFARWQEQNREFLALSVDDLHARIVRGDPVEARRGLAAVRSAMEHPPAFVRLGEAFGLDDFERDLVLLCFAAELDPRFRIDQAPVTVGYALEAVPGAHWTALDVAAPLSDWGILETGRASSLADTTMRLADDVRRFVMGFDPRAGDPLFTRAPLPPAILDSQATLAEDLAPAIATTFEVTGESPAVELHGAEEEDRIAIALVCAGALGADLSTVAVRDLPAPGAELEATLARWSRCGHMTSTLLCLLEADARDEDPAIRHRVDRALSRVRGPLFVSVQRPTTLEPLRPVIRRRVESLTAEERLEVWQVCLDASRGRLGSPPASEPTPGLAALADDFRLGVRTIQRVCLETEAVLVAERDGGQGHIHQPAIGERLERLLRHGCARAVRARLDPLAQRIVLESVADVVLPETESRLLSELEVSIQLSNHVSWQWGLGRGRMNSTTALFAGPSGTGKTHAALAIAQRLGLDLYRVNLASVLSKYIGETEKNLDRIFDAAEVGGVILLFDEADALFGKRSEVRDSHDRYANLGTAYLLARIEAAPTPTILTTNLKDAIDPAFLRRLHFVIDFPFPAEDQRREIWRTIYPERTPVADLDPARLAVVAASGGMISNIARRSAFLAASEPASVEMRHVFEGTKRELRKVGRQMTPAEMKAWPQSG